MNKIIILNKIIKINFSSKLFFYINSLEKKNKYYFVLIEKKNYVMPYMYEKEFIQLLLE